MRLSLVLVLTLSLALSGCKKAEPFSSAIVNRAISGSSKYPVAMDPSRVGTYPGHVKSGAGYFYDDVLEYRVWLHPERGAKPLAGDADYFASFAEYEAAVAFAGATPGAEEPLVLVRQLEWIDEPSPGQYTAKQGERLAEWRVVWLADSKRGPESIQTFLAHPPRTRAPSSPPA